MRDCEYESAGAVVSGIDRCRTSTMRTAFAGVMIALLMGILCGGTVAEAASEISPNSNHVYGLAEAMELGHVRVTASSHGTYREVEYTVVNVSRERIKVRFDAGMYFQNPNSMAQNLVTLQDLGEFSLTSSRSKTVRVASACTNADLAVPGVMGSWSSGDAPLGIDHAVRFYGKHQKTVDKWLAKKNPELFGTADGRQVFLQLVIWAYLDAQYDDILRMLAGTVFKDDLAKAEDFIQQSYESAKEIARLIKERDTRAMAAWARKAIAENVDADAIREKGRGLWRGVRDRFNR